MRALVVLAALGGGVAALTPEQVHVTLGSDPTSSVNVQWHLRLGAEGSGALAGILASSRPTVKYWLADKDESTAKLAQDGKTWPFTKEFTSKLRACEVDWNHARCVAATDATSVVYITGLAAGTLYKYRVSADGGATFYDKLFSVKTQPAVGAGAPFPPLTYAVWGDLGDFNGQARPMMIREAQAGRLDMVMHVGDFAYNFNSDDGANGDAFMRDMEDLYAYVPTMPLPGNHESSAHFNQYTQRFRSVASNARPLEYPEYSGQNMTNSWYYSFQTGYLYVIYFSSELYFDEQFRSQRADQFDFIKAELTKANDPEVRRLRPWLILAAHRPMYCSAESDCDDAATNLREGVEVKGVREHGLAQLFHEYGVDMFLCGHVHNFERMYEIYPKYNSLQPYLSGWTERKSVNPGAVTYYLTGAAGNVERHDLFERPAAQWDAKRIGSYGWSRMTVANGTHIMLEFVQTDSTLPASEQGKVVDSAWLVQEKHGIRRRNGTTPLGVAALQGADTKLPVQSAIGSGTTSSSSTQAMPSARPRSDVVAGRDAQLDPRPACSKPKGASLEQVKCVPRIVHGVELREESIRFERMLRQKGFWQATRDFVADPPQEEGLLV